ncbi:MAG: MFS transporter, partial [Ktedonobacteraceae bacterium]|nr:MFS transporter [Ktedonobacteraceae bacterium]
LGLFKRFPFSATSLVSLLVGAALIIAMADIPIFVDTVLQAPVLDSGLALLRLTAMIPVGALLGGWLCHRITCRWTAVIGLLFTAAGFYLMSLWPIKVDWTQITISTVVAGLGFGLVIAPIGTTAINAVRARQAGMSSAVVTALRMLGMTLGLAALTSWALAYFKELAKQYPSLPFNATADQFTVWQQGYAQHLVRSAHTVYSAVFFATMLLCLVAIIPALFLWGRQKTVAELEPEPEIDEIPTSPMVQASSTAERAAMPTQPDQPLTGGTKWWRNKKRRRLVLGVGSVGLLLLLVGGGLLSAWMMEPDDSLDDITWPTVGSTPGNNATSIASGPHSVRLGLDKGALTSIFVSQLNLQQGGLSDLSVRPLPGDTLALSLSLHIDLNGIQRVLPIEIEGAIKLDQQQNLQIHVKHLKRDGQDAGAEAAAQMESALNKMLMDTVMPALRSQLKNVKLTSVHTSTSMSCSKGTEMLVLQLDSTQGNVEQGAPLSFCFTGPIDLNKLLPHQ